MRGKLKKTISDVITYPLYMISVALKSGTIIPHVEEFKNKIYANIEIGQKQANKTIKKLEEMMIKNKSFSLAINAAGFTTTEVNNRKDLNIFITQFKEIDISGIFYSVEKNNKITHIFVDFDNISKLVLP